MSEETKYMKVVIFVSGPDDSSCLDEKWRRLQIVLPESYYKILKNLLLNLDDLSEMEVN